jgi:hypothetical protein
VPKLIKPNEDAKVQLNMVRLEILNDTTPWFEFKT